MPGNAILTPHMIANEALMLLENNLVVANLVYRDHESTFANAKVGDTITIRKPPDFEVTEFGRTTVGASPRVNQYGATPVDRAFADGTRTTRADGTATGPAVSGGTRYSPEIYIQDISEGGVPMVLDHHLDISVGVGQREMTLEMGDFSRKIIAPAMLRLAEKIDALVYEQAKYIPYVYNLNGINPQALDTIAKVAQIDAALMTQKVPMVGRVGIVNPLTKASLMSIDVFHRADARGDAGTALRDASLGRVMGVDWYGAQAIARRAAPDNAGATVQVNGATSKGVTSLSLEAASAAYNAVVGDVLIIGGNQYMVTTTVTVASGGNATVGIYPALKTDVLDNASVTIVAAHAMNLVGNFQGISLAVIPLDAPMAANSAVIQNRGFSIRVVYDYNIVTKTNILSFDVLCGCRVIYPEMLARIATT